MAEEVDFKILGLEEFGAKLRQITTAFPEAKAQEMLKLGYMLDREIVLQITEDNVVDTGRLRASFTVDQGSTVSKPAPEGTDAAGTSEGGMGAEGTDVIRVGTNVNYARAVNDGHEVTQHFVPGEWVNGRFNYIPYDGSDVGGMMVHAQFIMGRHFMEKGMTRYKPIAEAEIEKWVAKMLDQIDKRNQKIMDDFNKL